MNTHHPVHLCQPDKTKSCGACCGLYNWEDHSRPALQAILKLQTALVPLYRETEDFTAYLKLRDIKIKNKKLFETIYNCEFLGFIDDQQKKVGCLLHPAVTGGHDLRDYCFYGREICSSHFCPGYSCLTTIEQNAVAHCLNDWYLYGLVITDIDLVKEFFKYVENKIGDSIKEHQLHSPKVDKALNEFFSLKESWIFKTRENRLGKYYFSETEYNIARIEYGKRWGIPASRFDKILVSLESDFQTENDLHQAENIIEDTVDQFINAISGIIPDTGS